MTDKQIIVDGVDVSGCKYWKGYCRIASLCDYAGHLCEVNPNCYYKQLKRKEQECEELKKVNRHIEHNRNQKANKLMRIEKLITACSTGYTDDFIQSILAILLETELTEE